MAKEFAKMVKEIALSAREFVKDAREQEKRRANGAKPEVESVQPEEPRGGADADADLSANMYAKHTIIPAIDSLIDNHKDGQGIGREEVEKTFDFIGNIEVEALVEAKVLNDAIVITRDLVNEPSNVIYPETLAIEAKNNGDK